MLFTILTTFMAVRKATSLSMQVNKPSRELNWSQMAHAGVLQQPQTLGGGRGGRGQTHHRLRLLQLTQVLGLFCVTDKPMSIVLFTLLKCAEGE